MEISERLLSAYPAEDAGVWEIYGEAFILEGEESVPLLEIITGIYEKVLEFAVGIPRFHDGIIVKRDPLQFRDIDYENAIINSLEEEKRDLLQKIQYINKHIEYINKEIGLRIRSKIL